MSEKKTQNVYQAINAITEELATVGISKDNTNTQQNYKFRGIDDVYNALSRLLAKHKLVIMPYVLSREVTERQSVKEWQGKERVSTLFYVLLQVRYDFISVADGSKHEVVVYGEAMDSGDKATNKAMSAAYKYACLQTFAIPTEGDNDADKTTHENIKPSAKQVYGTFKAMKDRCDAIENAVKEAKTFEALKEVGEENKNHIDAIKGMEGGEMWYEKLKKLVAEQKLIIQENNASDAAFKGAL